MFTWVLNTSLKCQKGNTLLETRYSHALDKIGVLKSLAKIGRKTICFTVNNQYFTEL